MAQQPIRPDLAAGQGSTANQTPPGIRPELSSQSEPTWFSVDRFLLVGTEVGIGKQAEEMPPTPLLLTGGGPPLPAHHLLPARLPRLPLLANQGAGDRSHLPGGRAGPSLGWRTRLPAVGCRSGWRFLVEFSAFIFFYKKYIYPI